MPPDATPSRRAYAAALATIILWASAFPAIAVGLRHVEPAALAATRFAVAGAVAACWLGCRARGLPKRADLARVLACGMLGIALYNLLLNLGQRTISPGAASFIVATQTVFAAGLACLLRQERGGVFTIAGTLLSLLGTGIISLGIPGETRLGAGALLVLLAAICSGTTFVVQRPLVCRYGAAKAAGWPLIVGALLLAPWLPAGLKQAAAAPEAIAAIAFLAVGAGVLGYACWMVALAGLGASRAANFLFLMAPLATVLAIPINGHIPPPTTILGGAATLAGVWIVHRAYRRAPATDPES